MEKIEYSVKYLVDLSLYKDNLDIIHYNYWEKMTLVYLNEYCH